MTRLNIDLFVNDDDDLNHAVNASRSRKKALKRSTHALLDEAARHAGVEQLGAEGTFAPSLGSSRHEREWIFTYLGPFYDSLYITDVISRVKGGKEANVYVCTAHPSLNRELVAAKLYRPRMFRNLRNDARYRTGRALLDADGKEVWNGDTLHAVQKGTNKGKEMAHTSWLGHEYRTMQILYDAGVPVPEPITLGGNTILMEYVGGLDLPAPALTETTLTRVEAHRVYDQLIMAVEQMLVCGRIHGDLSGYNVLYWDGKPYIIDFPQAIDPAVNPDAFDIFYRDVERICQHFERYGIHSRPYNLSRSIWQRHLAIPQPPNPEEFEEA